MRNALGALKGKISLFARLPSRFTIFLGGLTVSHLGDALYTLAIPWIAYELTRSVLVMSSLYATEVLPIVLFGPFIGVYLDRLDRRKLMMAADMMRAGLVALIPILHMAGILRVWHLYAVSFLLALLTMVFDVATMATIPEMVGDNLTRANAAHRGATHLASMMGPALAGVLIAAIGGYQTLWFDVLSFGATFLTLLRMPVFQRHNDLSDRGHVLKDMLDGFRWLVKSPLNRTLSLQAAIGNFGYSAAAAVLMYDLRDSLRLNADRSGVIYALLGLGALIGSVAVVPLDKRCQKRNLIPSLLAFGVTGFLLAAFSRFWLAPGLGFAMVAACNVAWSVISASVRQKTVPPHMLGRVLSFSRVLTRVAMPIGALLGGLLTHTFDPAAVFLLAAGTKAVEVLIALYSPIRELT